jgi:magnesium chelatase subunit I
MQPVVQWFDIGGNAETGRGCRFGRRGAAAQLHSGLMEKTRALGLTANEPDAVRASAGEFILEGLYAHRKISRSEERGFRTAEERKRPARSRKRVRGRGSGVSSIKPGEGIEHEVDQVLQI